MEIPEKPAAVLRRLREHGYAAYVVGGCVRDTLLGRIPGDWDICTAALPEETERCFSDCRVVETGLKHGTVTVLWEGEPFEITTFRRDGTYRDHRSPEQVAFVDSLEEDLARRDFTINAMAVGLDGMLRDPFGGRQDLREKRIRCVGTPEQRFAEDALRILRGLRFASQLEFSIESDTAVAMERSQELLKFVSGERLYAELTKLLMGSGVTAMLTKYGAVLQTVLPEIGSARGFLQHSPHHDSDVWSHTAMAVGYGLQEPAVRWALLFHDLGKPCCMTRDADGSAHFYGHAGQSAEMAEAILRRLHGEKAFMERVCTLVREHDRGMEVNRKTVRRWISRFGQEQLFQLLAVMEADCLAHVQTPLIQARYKAVLDFTALARQVLAEECCFTLKDLAVNGRDILALGVSPGPSVGELLQGLLTEVLEDRCANEKGALLERLLELMATEKGQSHAD